MKTLKIASILMIAGGLLAVPYFTSGIDVAAEIEVVSGYFKISGLMVILLALLFGSGRGSFIVLFSLLAVGIFLHSIPEILSVFLENNNSASLVSFVFFAVMLIGVAGYFVFKWSRDQQALATTNDATGRGC